MRTLRSVAVTKRAPLLGVSSLPALAAVAVLALACGAQAPTTQHSGAAETLTISQQNLTEVIRQHWRFAPDDPERLRFRDAIVTYLAERGRVALLEAGEYEPVIARLTELAEFVAPQDIERGSVPRAMLPYARWVVEHGSQRGDEGAVMGALSLVIALSDEAERERARAERERIARWGVETRAHIGNPLARFGTMIETWRKHVRIAPHPDAMATVARLVREQRDAIVRGDGLQLGGSPRGRLNRMQLAQLLVQRAPLDVAQVYLSRGQLDRAVEEVRGMAGEGDLDRQLLQLLVSAAGEGEAGATALRELAGGFQRSRRDVAAAVCRVGLRRFPQDAHFARCLARVAMQRGDYGTSTAWYADAVRLSPTDRDTYDEALGGIAYMIENGLVEQDIRMTRAFGEHALHVLQQHRERWPERQPAVQLRDLLLVLGRAEMSAGHVMAARNRFLESLEAGETRQAHQELGVLLERVERSPEAVAHYRRALALTPANTKENTAQRAQALEHLGDALRKSGQSTQARQRYGEALELWRRLMSEVRGPRRAIIHVRTGILHNRLGRNDEMVRAFGEAMQAAPAWREPYAAILSHLVVTQPHFELALDVLRRAQYQLTLEPEWKVYFALWVQTVAARASVTADADLRQILREGGRGRGWFARLAQFGQRELPFAQLVEAASNTGERAEAQFYEGARLLGRGDVAGARRHFEEVIDTGMVNYFEYAMAQELLARLASPDPAE